MSQEIYKRQEVLVNALISTIKELGELNRQVDHEHAVDLFVGIGQHRHAFEEQKVTDHQNCISTFAIAGSQEGICGLLMYAADNDPRLQHMLIEVVCSFILR